MIPENWEIDKDILPGQVFICAECLSYGKLQDDHTIKLINEGTHTISKYGKDEDEPEDFDDFGALESFALSDDLSDFK